MSLIIRIFAALMNKLYGYEGLNLLFRFLPSSQIIKVLRLYGARIGRNVRILNPFVVHNADEGLPIYQNLLIGNDVFIGRYALLDLAEQISIGDRVTISHYCSIHTHTNAGKSALSRDVIPITKGPVRIDEDTYLGASVTILENVHIQSACIVAAGTLVKNNCRSKCLIAGVPGKVKKRLD
jgi:acetyltransferase-like isoleucine patch superfamily enzyme